ncbi:hypothetical protein GF312_01870 [Candidatus Poribacteria bacterium]|nr:hypothetical protein [Candidatus Poribacteria bacterium]
MTKETIRTGWRAIIIGLVLIPINSLWIASGEAVSTTVSLFYNVIFILFVVTLLNSPLRKWSPKFALNHGELLVIYVMLSIASAICGLDMMRILISVLVGPHWLATPENEWADLFWRFIPEWVTVTDRKILQGYVEGQTTLYDSRIWKAWVIPGLAWSGFIILLVFVMVCINVIVRKQWTEGEKLSYPIIQLPLHMTSDKSSFFKSKTMWIGFGIAGAIDIINGLNYLYPSVPGVGGKLYDMLPYFTEKPWNAIGWTPVAIFPYAVGLAFFIPLDLSFSCWFFYLFWKFERVLASAIGLRSLPEFPYIEQQTAGTYIGLCIIAVWATRKHITKALKTAILGSSKGMDDSQEAMKYRTTVITMLIALSLLFMFCLRLGMSIPVIIAFFVLYYALSTAITRMRAELGSPVHDLHFSGPDMMITKSLGARRLSPGNLTGLSFLWFFNRAYRGHVMPHQLEGFKLAERSGANNRKMLIAMVLAIILATPISFWAYLHSGYKIGGPYGYASQPFTRLQGWLYNPTSPDYAATSAMGFGMLSTIFLAFMRMRFIWWILHPAGYAVSSSWSMNVFWSSIFVSWAIKLTILKFGGLKLHRQSIPFFLGLVLGEFVIGSIWSIRGVALHIPFYQILF